ncbi:MAG: hypothetical protein U0Q11_27880 [Vicinamibacterales bacterium]
MATASQSITKALRDAFEALCERCQGRGHPAMEADEQEVTLLATEGVQVLAHEPCGHVGIEGLLLRAHRVVEHP